MRFFSLEFPLSRKARWEFKVDQMAETEAPLLLAEELAKVSGGRPTYASEIAAMGLLTEIFRFLWDRKAPPVEPKEPIEKTLRAFLEFFPPEKPLQPGREVIARELGLLALTTENGALDSYRPLFDDTELQHACPARAIVGEVGGSLLNFLREPLKASPLRLDGQLEYIREHWAHLLSEHLRRRLLLALDQIREETLERGAVVSASPEPLFFGEPDFEPERFSEDADWMSNLVLIAKNAYVWMDQLSKKYQRSIRHLDEIPDEELERLARYGFSGLWLIGIWKRSPASQQIKQRMGNADAVSSAYSLFDYIISENVGGEEALHRFAKKAKRYGIKLASDMVPNHVGLYSRWVVEHPDWFVQLEAPPFPNYSFNGPDLSGDGRISLFIEDGYWNLNDAAVVFKRVDNQTGEVRYLYHGNDGTHMPWNDTAQLNYLKEEVREAVIQTILHVARLFPIIRFDAAMTLAKKHYQRLWYPQPGEGGAIPSRAGRGMTQEEFDHIFPEEFWREVVDRVAKEAPNTLLLAEAFWLMEGYFVRTLGMHRVYNSAFMNMLKMEENANYRQTIKNVLDFSPEILKRFVNFMNNPDERTAVEQFGKGDKYFGVALMLATMPGLPMFGHGQIEGFAEKYGMEYRRAYWDEQVDGELVQRHERQIFPLLKRRPLFSGAEHFVLYDFLREDGSVDENVFAYSNQKGQERALVLYNNSYGTTSGCILGLKLPAGSFILMRDEMSGLEYIRQELFFELKGYGAHLFLNLRGLDEEYRALHDALGGRGVPDIETALMHLYVSSLVEGEERFLENLLKRLGKQERSEELQQALKKTSNPYLRGLALAKILELKKELLGERGPLIFALRGNLSFFADPKTTVDQAWDHLFATVDGSVLGLNWYEGKLWFSKERWEELLGLLAEASEKPALAKALIEKAKQSLYQVEAGNAEGEPPIELSHFEK